MALRICMIYYYQVYFLFMFKFEFFKELSLTVTSRRFENINHHNSTSDSY